MRKTKVEKLIAKVNLNQNDFEMYHRSNFDLIKHYADHELTDFKSVMPKDTKIKNKTLHKIWDCGNIILEVYLDRKEFNLDRFSSASH